MTNSKFSSPSTIGFLIVLAILFFSRIILIGSLFLLALGQMAAPHIISFVKTQLGSASVTSSISGDLRSAFDQIGVVEQVRLLDKSEPRLVKPEGSLHSPDDNYTTDLRSNTILATEMVLGALKTPKRTKSKSSKIVNPGKIENQPRKYLTAKEKLAEQNWRDRTDATDWNDKDLWLGSR